MTFHVGQKVVCVDVGEPNEHLRVGAVYTVAGGGGNWLREPSIFLVETKHPLSGLPFWSRRFRPIVERKTDISIFTKMLTPKKIGVDA